VRLITELSCNKNLKGVRLPPVRFPSGLKPLRAEPLLKKERGKRFWRGAKPLSYLHSPFPWRVKGGMVVK